MLRVGLKRLKKHHCNDKEEVLHVWPILQCLKNTKICQAQTNPSPPYFEDVRDNLMVGPSGVDGVPEFWATFPLLPALLWFPLLAALLSSHFWTSHCVVGLPPPTHSPGTPQPPHCYHWLRWGGVVGDFLTPRHACQARVSNWFPFNAAFNGCPHTMLVR